jgi:hypothetical protein
MIELQLGNILNIWIIILGMFSFAIGSMFFHAYNTNQTWALRLVNTPYFEGAIVQQDSSWKNLVVKSATVKHGNGIITIKKRSYLVTNSSEFHKGNRPYYVWYYDNPYPTTLKQYLADEKLLSVNGEARKVQSVFFATKRVRQAPYDSEELNQAINTKVWEKLQHLAVDNYKMFILIGLAVSVVVGIIAITMIVDDQQAISYLCKQINKISLDANIAVPDVQPKVCK